MAAVIPARKPIPKLSVGCSARVHTGSTRVHTQEHTAHGRKLARVCASRAVNSAVGTLRGVTDAQVLISYLSPCLITIIGRIVTSESPVYSVSIIVLGELRVLLIPADQSRRAYASRDFANCSNYGNRHECTRVARVPLNSPCSVANRENGEKTLDTDVIR